MVTAWQIAARLDAIFVMVSLVRSASAMRDLSRLVGEVGHVRQAYIQFRCAFRVYPSARMGSDKSLLCWTGWPQGGLLGLGGEVREDTGRELAA